MDNKFASSDKVRANERDLREMEEQACEYDAEHPTGPVSKDESDHYDYLAAEAKAERAQEAVTGGESRGQLKRPPVYIDVILRLKRVLNG